MRIAAEGKVAFYTGSIADHLAAKVQSQGGLITVNDMAEYPVGSERPLCATWRGWTVLSAPPPMGGASVLEMLQVADAVGIADAGGLTDRPAAVAMLADVQRIGQADGGKWRGDPFAQFVPARGASSLAYAKPRAGLVGGVFADSMVAGDPTPFDAGAPSASCTALDPYPAAAASPRTSNGNYGNASRTGHPSARDHDGGRALWFRRLHRWILS